MKSLNDIIWNEDIDLEEGKDGIGTLIMNVACLEASCGKPPRDYSYNPRISCPTN